MREQTWWKEKLQYRKIKITYEWDCLLLEIIICKKKIETNHA